MSLAISENNVNFQGNAINESGLTYYKSNKGTIAGTILAVPAAGIYLSGTKFKKNNFSNSMANLYKSANMKYDARYEKYLKDMDKTFSRLGKTAVPFAIVAAACTIGAGALFDKVRNKNASAAANDLVAGNYNRIYVNGDEVDYSAAGIPYYKSKNAAKFGAITGAVCGLIKGIMNCIVNSQFRPAHFVFPVALFTLGGMMMAAIAQNSANKAAEKATYV